MSNIDINEIKISYNNIENCFEFTYETNTYYGPRTAKVSTYNLHTIIISLGYIKIKNLLIKDFAANFNERDNYYPKFKTKEDAQKALDWIKQKVFETKIIGKDNLEAEKEKKIAENRIKRQQKQLEKNTISANNLLFKIEKYKGKEITFPVEINGAILNFKTILISINLKDLIYTVNTSAGKFKIKFKDLEEDINSVKAKFPGNTFTPNIIFKGRFEMLFQVKGDD